MHIVDDKLISVLHLCAIPCTVPFWQFFESHYFGCANNKVYFISTDKIINPRFGIQHAFRIIYQSACINYIVYASGIQYEQIVK